MDLSQVEDAIQDDDILSEYDSMNGETELESDIESTDVDSDDYSEYTDTDSETVIDSDSDDKDAIDEIRHYQNTTNLLINPEDFKNLVKEIIQDYKDYEIHDEAIKALQCVTEDYIIELFQKSQVIAVTRDHNKNAVIEGIAEVLDTITDENVKQILSKFINTIADINKDHEVIPYDMQWSRYLGEK